MIEHCDDDNPESLDNGRGDDDCRDGSSKKDCINIDQHHHDHQGENIG